MIATVIALGLVLERWWRSTLVATALVWPPQLDGSGVAGELATWGSPGGGVVSVRSKSMVPTWPPGW
jgi:hypothetical protein